MRIYIRYTRTNVRLSNESSSHTKLDAHTYTDEIPVGDATCLIICILRIRAALHRLMPVYSAMPRVYAAKGRIGYRTSFTVPSSQQGGERRQGRANKGALMKPRAFVPILSNSSFIPRKIRIHSIE